MYLGRCHTLKDELSPVISIDHNAVSIMDAPKFSHEGIPRKKKETGRELFNIVNNVCSIPSA